MQIAFAESSQIYYSSPHSSECEIKLVGSELICLNFILLMYSSAEFSPQLFIFAFSITHIEFAVLFFSGIIDAVFVKKKLYIILMK